MKEIVGSLRSREPLSILAELGIKTSHPRLLILRYLLDHDTHPSVDGIYRDLGTKTPGLSRTTVYNALKLFVSKGLIAELTIDGTESRYDVSDSSHSHFQCRECGRIFDVAIPPKRLTGRSMPAGFHVEEQHLYLRGLCPECVVKPKKKK
jgi:Fur family transcriptional regulator, peroxide stress response regulator